MQTDELLGGRPIPVFALTGFLGSGKTSLLARLLEEPRMARTAIIVNEMGDVGIDQLTIRQVDDSVRLLANGCVCCVTRDDLLETLRDLYVSQLDGRVDACDRVIIETSGIVDPIPVIHTLLVDPQLQERFVYRGTLVTIDLLQEADSLFARTEGARQVAAADLFVLTKSDLADQGTADRIEPILRRTNPVASVVGNDDPSISELATVIAEERVDSSLERLSAAQWLLTVLGRTRSGPKEASAPLLGGVRFGRHISPVESYVVRLHEPVQWSVLVAWLQGLISQNSESLLRLKGVVEVDGQEDLVIVQAVRHLFHPCVSVPRRPEDQPGSRFVVIVDNKDRKSWEKLGTETLGDAVFSACARNEASSICLLEQPLI